MASPPRSAPEKSLREPIRRPTGVRAPATMTALLTIDPLAVGWNLRRPTCRSDLPGRSGQQVCSRLLACDHDTVGAMTENSATTPSAAPGGIADGYVTAIDHVGIAVPDFAAAVQWHRDHLGLVLAHEEINEDQGVREGMLSPAGTAFGVET